MWLSQYVSNPTPLDILLFKFILPPTTHLLYTSVMYASTIRGAGLNEFDSNI
jgi:hypothetical protein